MTSGKTSHDVSDLTSWRSALPDRLVLPAGKKHKLEVHVKHGDDAVVSLTEIRAPQIAAQPVGADSERKLTQLDIWHDPQTIDGELRGRATFELPADLDSGYYRAELISNSYNASSLVLLTPASGQGEAEVNGWGISLDLPATRSRRSWGVGDVADLAELGVLAANWGADFIFARPQTLRAFRFEGESLAPAGFLPAPVRARYLPASVLRVEEIPELAYISAPDRALIEWDAEEFTGRNATTDDLDIGLPFQGKSAALDLIATIALTPARQLEYERYLASQGEDLETFALWAAIAEHCHRTGQEWPEDAETPESFGALRVGDDLTPEIEKHRRFQWHIHQQMALAHERARASGMRVGLVRAALWQPDTANLENNGVWIQSIGRGVGGLRITPLKASTADAQALAVLAIEAHRLGIELLLSVDEGSDWDLVGRDLEVCVRVQPWRVTADRVVINSDSLTKNQFIEARVPLDIPLANYLSEEFPDALPERLDERAREEFRRIARLVHFQLSRELSDHGLTDDSVSQRGIMEALHIWALQQKPRLTVLRLCDLIGQRNWSGEDTAWQAPLTDSFGAPALIDDLPEAPTMLSLLRRFESMEA